MGIGGDGKLQPNEQQRAQRLDPLAVFALQYDFRKKSEGAG